MNWSVLEKLVADCALNRCLEALEKDPDDFSRNFAEALRQLGNTRWRDPNYDIPFVGEAYVLKYHLQRMDNVNTALKYVNEVDPVLHQEPFRVLDVGAGTGASAMAIARWFHNNLSVQVEVRGCEPKQKMREVGEDMVQTFLEEIGGSSISMFEGDLYSCDRDARGSIIPQYEMINFSFTFWRQNSSHFERTSQYVLNIARSLKPGGLLMFLTPNSPEEKMEFMRFLDQKIIGLPFTKLDVVVPTQAEPHEASFPTETCESPCKWPLILQDHLIKINDAAFERCGSYPMGAQFLRRNLIRDDDRPYCGYYCHLHAYIKR